MTHDISLDEFEDDDLSEITEITDERGVSLNCNGPDLKVRKRLPADQWGAPSSDFLLITIISVFIRCPSHTSQTVCL